MVADLSPINARRLLFTDLLHY